MLSLRVRISPSPLIRMARGSITPRDPVDVARRYASLRSDRRLACPTNPAHQRLEYEMVDGMLHLRCAICSGSRSVSRDEIDSMQALLSLVGRY
jgi:hypothetical protein